MSVLGSLEEVDGCCHSWHHSDTAGCRQNQSHPWGCKWPIINTDAGEGDDEVPVSWYARILLHFVTCLSSMKLVVQLLTSSGTTFNDSTSPLFLFNNAFCALPVCSGVENLRIHHQHVYLDSCGLLKTHWTSCYFGAQGWKSSPHGGE